MKLTVFTMKTPPAATCSSSWRSPPPPADVKEYIRIVKDKALLRRIAETAGGAHHPWVQEGGETAQAVLDLAEQRVYAIRQGRSAQGLEPLSKILVDVFDQLQELSMSGSEVPGMATRLRGPGPDPHRVSRL